MYIFYTEFHPIRISDHFHTQPDLTLEENTLCTERREGLMYTTASLETPWN